MRNDKYFVLDTNLLVSGLLFKNSTPSKVFDFATLQGRLLFSKETFKEIEDVLSRPKFDRYLSLEIRKTSYKTF